MATASLSVIVSPATIYATRPKPIAYIPSFLRSSENPFRLWARWGLINRNSALIRATAFTLFFMLAPKLRGAANPRGADAPQRVSNYSTEQSMWNQRELLQLFVSCLHDINSTNRWHLELGTLQITSQLPTNQRRTLLLGKSRLLVLSPRKGLFSTNTLTEHSSYYLHKIKEAATPQGNMPLRVL